MSQSPDSLFDLQQDPSLFAPAVVPLLSSQRQDDDVSLFSQDSDVQGQGQQGQRGQGQGQISFPVLNPQQFGHEKEFTCDCLPAPQSVSIKIFAMDSIIDIKMRISVVTNHFPTYIFFKEDFLQTRLFLDLFQVFDLIPKQVKKPIRRPTIAGGGAKKKQEPAAATAIVKHPLIDIFECAVKYGVKLYLFLKLYVIFKIYKDYPFLVIPEQKRKPNENMVIQKLPALIGVIIDNLPLDKFSTRCINQEVKKEYTKADMKKNWTPEMMETELKNMMAKQERMKVSVEEWADSAIKFESLPVLPIRDEKIVGQLESFKVGTQDTTGILFDKLALNIDYPLAKYKEFYKIFIMDNGFTKTQNEEITMDTNSTLRIIDKDGRLCFYIENQPKGIKIQCVLENESGLPDRDSLIQFLNISEPQIQASVSMGIVTEFFIDNTSKFPLDSSIFSNLCMNNKLFSRFFKTNDTDKISRGKSVFIYFTDYGNRQAKTSQQDIHVGGWNKIVSRFGDLTAILSSFQKKEKSFVIHVKVIRSSNIDIVKSFQIVLGKLLNLYAELYTSQVALFKQYNPKFEAYVPPPQKEAAIMSTSGLPSSIFSGVIYSRSCQYPKPKIISAEKAATITPDKKLLFPSIPYKNFEPQWYECPHSSKIPKQNFVYPGLVEVKDIGHPFGYAPCCYRESSLQDNTQISKDLEFYINNHYFEYFDKTVPLASIPKKTDRKTTSIILNFIGQEAPLPEKLEQFMTLLEPSLEFNRVGTSKWKYDSLIGCLEYRRAKLDNNIMQSPRDLRAALSATELNVGMQQNYDIGVEGILEILQDPNIGLEAKRFIRILEEYYNINIFVFTQTSDRQIDILRPHNYKEYYYSFWNTIKQRPIVFLIEYEISLKYELIMSRDDEGEIYYDFDCYKEYKGLLLHAYGTFCGQTPIVIPTDSICRPFFTHQILDCYGKTRILLLQNLYPALLREPISPLSLPSVPGDLPIPSYSALTQFLDAHGIPIVQMYHYKQNLILGVQDFGILYFICSSKGLQQKLKDCDIPSITTSKDANLIEIVGLLKNQNQNFIMTKQNIRLVNAIKDLTLYHFSLFIKDILPKITLFNIGQSIDQFFELETSFVPVQQITYTSVHNIHPRFSNNPHLIKDGKLILPAVLKRKLYFFLQWYSVTKTDLFHDYKNLIEIPNYFSYTSDFVYKPNHIIQTSLNSFKNSSTQTYVKEPLASLKSPTEKLFFYYNPRETPQNKPYLALITADFDFGCRIASYFSLHKSIKIPEHFNTIFAYKQAIMSQGKTKWIKKKSGETKFLVFVGNNGLNVFLMDF